MNDLERDPRLSSRVSLVEWSCLLGALLLGAVCGEYVFGLGSSGRLATTAAGPNYDLGLR